MPRMATKEGPGGCCVTLLARFENNNGLLILVLIGKLELMTLQAAWSICKATYRLGRGAGRPRGSRQSLSDQFIADLSEFWEREGQSILAQVAAERPGELVRAVARLVPKQEKPQQEGVVMVLNYTGINDAEE